MNKKNFRNMTFLVKQLSKNKNFHFLAKLVLSDNNIESIKPLVRATYQLNIFAYLEHLDLSINPLGDKNIKYISELNCPNLKNIYLHRNGFTDYMIFQMLNEKFKNLEILFLGFNRFEKNIENLKELVFEKLKKIGLNYAFNDDNYINLEKFKLKNIEKLYIQNNSIESLDILQNMDLFGVKEIYLINNELEVIDVNSFSEFLNLERVYIDNSTSKIINFSKLEDLKKLKFYDFNDNQIDLEPIKGKNLLIRDLEIKL